jgi:AraC-like DNA-binding protein
MQSSDPLVEAWRDDAAAPSALQPAPVPSFGARSAIAKDNIYFFGTRGLIFTSPWVVTLNTERQPAVILLSASGRPIELAVGGRASRHRAFAIAPLTRRDLCAVDIGLISVNVQPHHPCFGAFCRISEPGARALPRSAFARFDAELVRAYEGRLLPRDAEALFENVIETAVVALEAAPGHDERAAFLHALLRQKPDCSLDEIARALNVSYTNASHLFARAVGLPLRTYQHWIKCMRASQLFPGGATLTEIAQVAGFADSAHLSRAWQRRYGLTPSYLRNRAHVRIIH